MQFVTYTRFQSFGPTQNFIDPIANICWKMVKNENADKNSESGRRIDELGLGCWS